MAEAWVVGAIALFFVLFDYACEVRLPEAAEDMPDAQLSGGLDDEDCFGSVRIDGGTVAKVHLLKDLP